MGPGYGIGKDEVEDPLYQSIATVAQPFNFEESFEFDERVPSEHEEKGAENWFSDPSKEAARARREPAKQHMGAELWNELMQDSDKEDDEDDQYCNDQYSSEGIIPRALIETELDELGEERTLEGAAAFLHPTQALHSDSQVMMVQQTQESDCEAVISALSEARTATSVGAKDRVRIWAARVRRRFEDGLRGYVEPLLQVASTVHRHCKHNINPS